MSATPAASNRLLAMPLRQEQDVVLCRHRSRTFAAALRFPAQEQTRIATAVSEIARNAFTFARRAAVEFLIESDSSGAQTFVVLVRDEGPGIADLNGILAGTFRSSTGLGKGIIGAKRLIEEMEISSSAAGTTIRLPRKLPHGHVVPDTQLRRIVDEITSNSPVDPLEEMASQNRELLSTLADVTSQRKELETINVELSETNRGVVALYDELDTVYRVGRVVASKLDLDSLFQAITDATTDVSGAECGAFFHQLPDKSGLTCQSVSGRLGDMLRSSAPRTLAELMGGAKLEFEIFRVDDLAAPGALPSPVGKEMPLRSYLSVAVRDSTGEIAGALVFGHSSPRAFSERTERIIASVAVQASIGLENARLYHSVQAASAAKDHFLAILSHELRTPLNPVFAIIASLEQRNDLDEEVRSDLIVVRRNLQLEARLIDDLLDLTRIVKGKVPLHREVVDVHSLIISAQETCHDAIEKKRVEVEFHSIADRSHVTGDPARLQQVFWNLLSNAVKFTPNAGKVVIRTSVTDHDELCIRVVDSGRGISTDAISRIFRPFEQGDVDVPAQFGGLGLGLAISKSIIDAHGGSIRAESPGEGLGATFVVTLPLTETPVASSEPTQLRIPLSKKETLRILLVDDHEDTRDTLKRLLSRRGHTITLASTCEEARAAAREQVFDLLISDLGLPDGSGHDLMRDLHGTYRLRGIALSGFGMESDVERSHAAGFSAHMTKPLDFAVLEATIEKTVSDL